MVEFQCNQKHEYIIYEIAVGLLFTYYFYCIFRDFLVGQLKLKFFNCKGKALFRMHDRNGKLRAERYNNIE